MLERKLHDDNNIDDHVDDEIRECLRLDKLKSFFLFAGAGSGKTRSLVNALNQFRERNGIYFRLNGQRVAVITYTNAACDEIKRRLDYDSLFVVSTIHSFVWDLINSFQNDIRAWVEQHLITEIKELQLQQQKGRPGTKIAIDREKSIESKLKRIQNLDKIKRFTYNPNGDNRGRDSLNHTEVISIGAYFLTNKALMQTIMVKKFPILLVDESQDTNKELMNAFFEVQALHGSRFCLGLFGDTMQRIYTDGKIDLGKDLPENWSKPVKIMNHRCPPRIIRLINKIRFATDGQEQKARTDKQEGIARLFISNSTADKASVERIVAERMATITNDSLWEGPEANYKMLILEHHMAASRMGFLDLFEPLYQIDTLKTGLLDGSLPGLRFFTQLVLPLIKAKENDDPFAVANLVKKYSPLMSKENLKASGDNQIVQLRSTRDAVNQLYSLWADDKEPLIIQVLQCVAKTKLFSIPDSLYPIASRNPAEVYSDENANSELLPDAGQDEKVINAWDKCLKASFSQLRAYDSYISGQSNFATHQGVKGLEFPRVMVIIDDNEARGFLFSYEKLFGAKEKTANDLKNEQEGKDTSIDRTRRLFYVTCSRAEESLAILAYSEDPAVVKKHVLDEAWFHESEIEIIS